MPKLHFEWLVKKDKGMSANACVKCEREAKVEASNALAREEEKKILAGRDEFLRQCREEQDRQVAGFGFECNRFGQFLTLRVRRDGNPERDVFARASAREYETAINMNKVTNINFVPGRLPDTEGDVNYKFWCSSSEKPSASASYIPDSRTLFSSPTPSSSNDNHYQQQHGFGHDPHPYQPTLVTKSYPRPAVDDQIVFVGIGEALYVPAGLGQAVYQKILKTKEKK